MCFKMRYSKVYYKGVSFVQSTVKAETKLFPQRCIYSLSFVTFPTSPFFSCFFTKLALYLGQISLFQ